MKKHKILGLLLVLTLALVGCGSDDAEEEEIPTDYSPEEFIIGIEPGSGTAQISEEVIEVYDLDQEMTSNSSAVMTQLLGDAYKKKDPIVVTGWVPHWIFGEYDLKFLEDPKKAFGEPEQIETLARKGFKEDNPGAYKLLENFSWTPEDMESVLTDIHKGEDVKLSAQKWVDNNRDKVDEWTKDVPDGKGQSVKLGYTIWDSEYSSAHVVMTVLEEKGYDVIMMAVEPGPLFAALAYGSCDATVSAWLPKTHKNYMDKYGDMIDDLGPNLEGASIGFVVPTYMDIDSIEELKDYKEN